MLQPYTKFHLWYRWLSAVLQVALCILCMLAVEAYREMDDINASLNRENASLQRGLSDTRNIPTCSNNIDLGTRQPKRQSLPRRGKHVRLGAVESINEFEPYVDSCSDWYKPDADGLTRCVEWHREPIKEKHTSDLIRECNSDTLWPEVKKDLGCPIQ